ncbi:MAG: hypothetical protein AABX89_07355 [Candidatus Thermoplasmatota archaeon]
MRVVTRAGIDHAMRAIRQHAREQRSAHKGLTKFVADYCPDKKPAIDACNTRFRVRPHKYLPDKYRVEATSCHQVPFCVLCNKRRQRRRMSEAFNALYRCTPEGKAPRFVHIVQTAPILEDGTGWGMPASRNAGTFAKMVWQTIEDHVGEGAGGWLTYQDFGERSFAKRHPHIDMTLNGWQLVDGQPQPTKRIDLTGHGARRFQELLAQRATRWDIRAFDFLHPRSLHITEPRVGIPDYAKILQYQLRELVDLRKIDYSRDQKTVWWNSYKDNQRTKFTVGDFLLGLTEYEHRLGPWSQDERRGRQILHWRYGHLADRTIGKTEKAMGGTDRPHGTGCPCMECQDWGEPLSDEELSGPADDRPPE